MIISSSPHQKLAAWLENKENSHKAMETSLETYIEKENRMVRKNDDNNHKKLIITTTDDNDYDDDDDLPSVQESFCSSSESEHTSITHRSEHLEEEEDDDEDDELYDAITGINKEIEDECYNDTSHSMFHYSDYHPTKDELNDSFSKLKSIANSKHIMFECHDTMSQYSSMYPDAATIFSSSTTTTSLSSSKFKKKDITKSNRVDSQTKTPQRRETDINPLFSSSSTSSPFSGHNSTASNHQQQEQQRRKKVERIKRNFPLPTKCEHCGCSNNACSPDCKRPKSFFQRQRPPFVSKGNPKWNLQTDYENEKVAIKKLSSSSSHQSSTPIVLREWDHTRSSTIQIQQQRKQQQQEVVESSSSVSTGISWITSWWN